MLSFEQIKELIELVARNKLQGLEVERSGFRLSIAGQEAMPSNESAQVAAGQPRDGHQPQAAPAAPAAAPPPSAAEAEAAEEHPESHTLTSPIVGTFYAAPSPDAEPFVRVGDQVRKGQVLCIVEAMKLMNEIESDVDGELVKVYPKNAQPVEFGEPLFAIRT